MEQIPDLNNVMEILNKLVESRPESKPAKVLQSNIQKMIGEGKIDGRPLTSERILQLIFTLYGSLNGGLGLDMARGNSDPTQNEMDRIVRSENAFALIVKEATLEDNLNFTDESPEAFVELEECCKVLLKEFKHPIASKFD